MEKIYKEELQKLMPIFKAMAEGRTIQVKNGNGWEDIDGDKEGLYLDYLAIYKNNYRIKPESKFRPFKNAEECWAEIQKHQPAGFVKFKNAKSGYYMITFITSGAIVGMNNTPFSYEDMFDSYTFADGTPFGIKEWE